MADNNPKKPIPPASTQRTTMVMVIILLAVAFFVGSQFMRTGAMGTTVTDQLITSEFTQAVEQGRVKSVTYSAERIGAHVGGGVVVLFAQRGRIERRDRKSVV